MSHNAFISLKKCIWLTCDVTVQLKETVARRGQSQVTVHTHAAPGRSLPKILQRHQGYRLLDS